MKKFVIASIIALFVINGYGQEISTNNITKALDEIMSEEAVSITVVSKKIDNSYTGIIEYLLLQSFSNNYNFNLLDRSSTDLLLGELEKETVFSDNDIKYFGKVLKVNYIIIIEREWIKLVDVMTLKIIAIDSIDIEIPQKISNLEKPITLSLGLGYSYAKYSNSVSGYNEIFAGPIIHLEIPILIDQHYIAPYLEFGLIEYIPNPESDGNSGNTSISPSEVGLLWYIKNSRFIVGVSGFAYPMIAGNFGYRIFSKMYSIIQIGGWIGDSSTMFVAGCVSYKM